MVYKHLLNFWPLVPALDLKEVARLSDELSQGNTKEKYSDEPFLFLKLKQEVEGKDTVDQDQQFNCLLVGSSLGCLIKTLARAKRHRQSNLNIYVADLFSESLARCLILLSLMNDSSKKLSLQEKSETFLEILGNTHIRPQTAKYIENCSSGLLAKVGCLKEQNSVLPNVSLELMKQQEIDELMRILSHFKDTEASFDIGAAWEEALRSYYGQRFDNRKNLFDYHFNIRLSDYSIINLKKYIDWAESGVAFKFRKAKYSSPNKTMQFLSKIGRHNKSLADAYVGDIATSPYLVFGVETGDNELLKKVNKEYVSTGEDISKFNVVDMLEEFAASSKSKNSLKVHFSLFDTLCKNRKFTKFFDAIYVSCDMMHCANKVLPKFLKEGGGVVLFETIKNVVNSTKEHKAKHSAEIDLLMSSSGLKGLENSIDLSRGNFKIYTN
ncbi:hypothetical protein JTE90_027772 [Oedothorax gibbosus]|uniref:Uncharacterized protein n=1 Tax=Oedothorax gibbosus TaxID=931172 RepID=A0AAV6V878_9ARAC|nr:hypothetical protein JTE90_027772 [Oedothorax gibbosus]